jgi:LexA-binding, inner membrane-associated putative hydrolase
VFIGHFAVGFASKRAAPRASLGVLMAAPLFLDLLWPIFLIAGIETVRIEPGPNPFLTLDLHDFPWSHGLVTSLAWSLIAAALFWAATRYGRGAVVIGAGVFSHFVFDFVTHQPDMPLFPGSPTSIGLGLWRWPAATVAVEAALFVVGVAIYARTTRAINRRGAFAFWALVVVLVLLYASTVLGPPPGSVDFIKYGGLIGWLFPVWAWWIDRNRTMRAPPAAAAAG